MRTKKIILYYRLDPKTVTAPPPQDLARKDEWLKEIQRTMKEKDTVIIRLTYEIFNPEIKQIMKFFNGPVVEYYAIQNEDMLKGRPSRTMIEMYRETILDEALGYDIQLVDKKVRRRKSTADFLETQKWSDFLETLRETQFEPQGYEFPDSEHYWGIAEKAGEEQAREVVIKQLQERLKAKLSTSSESDKAL